MSSTNACGSSKGVPGSSPAILRNSLSPWTRPSIHLAQTSWPSRLPPISTLATPVFSFTSLEVCPPGVESAQVTAREDIAIVARQLAALTQTVEEMAGQLKEVLTQKSDSRGVPLDLSRSGSGDVKLVETLKRRAL